MDISEKDFIKTDNEISSLSKIKSYLQNLQSEEYVFPSPEMFNEICEMGITRVEILLNKSFMKKEVEEEVQGMRIKNIYYYPMNPQETLLCALYGYQLYIVKQHDTFTIKTVNFKTKGFATTGAGERTKEFMRTLWWLDGQIKELTHIIFMNNQGYNGYVTEMRGAVYGEE